MPRKSAISKGGETESSGASNQNKSQTPDKSNGIAPTKNPRRAAASKKAVDASTIPHGLGAQAEAATSETGKTPETENNTTAAPARKPRKGKATAPRKTIDVNALPHGLGVKAKASDASSGAANGTKANVDTADTLNSEEPNDSSRGTVVNVVEVEVSISESTEDVSKISSIGVSHNSTLSIFNNPESPVFHSTKTTKHEEEKQTESGEQSGLGTGTPIIENTGKDESELVSPSNVVEAAKVTEDGGDPQGSQELPDIADETTQEKEIKPKATMARAQRPRAAKVKSKTPDAGISVDEGAKKPAARGRKKTEQAETKKRSSPRKVKVNLEEVKKEEDGTKLIATITEEAPKKRRQKKPNKYGVLLGVTPYPEMERPSAAECHEVNKLLTEFHGKVNAPENIPVPSRSVAGCGEVKFVLEALVRTELSAHTSMGNANRAIQGLLNRYPTFKTGLCEGSVDWNSVRLASREDLENSIKSGGMGPSKSKAIKMMLDMVYEENQKKREELREKASQAASSQEAKEEMDTVEISEDPLAGDMKSAIMARLANQILLESDNILTLDYIHAMNPNEAFTQLITYPGIGVKTAACILLFCMQRPLFAVDTHVFRLCKWLGWVPEKATRDTVFAHCDVKVPDELKYSLHQLMIAHGKSCGKCRADTYEGSEAWEDVCVIEHLLTRTGKKKLGEKAKKRKKASDEDEEVDEEEEGETDTQIEKVETKKKKVAKKPRKGKAEDEDDEEEAEGAEDEEKIVKKVKKTKARVVEEKVEDSELGKKKTSRKAKTKAEKESEDYTEEKTGKTKGRKKATAAEASTTTAEQSTPKPKGRKRKQEKEEAVEEQPKPPHKRQKKVTGKAGDVKGDQKAKQASTRKKPKKSTVAGVQTIVDLPSQQNSADETIMPGEAEHSLDDAQYPIEVEPDKSGSMSDSGREYSSALSEVPSESEIEVDAEAH